MWHSRFLSTSCHWPACDSSASKDSFPSLGQEVSLTSTRSSALRKVRWRLVEGDCLFRESFGQLIC